MLDAMAPPRHQQQPPVVVETGGAAGTVANDRQQSLCSNNSGIAADANAVAITTTATTSTISTSSSSEADPLLLNDSGNNTSCHSSTASSSAGAPVSAPSSSSPSSSSSAASSSSSSPSSPSSPLSTTIHDDHHRDHITSELASPDSAESQLTGQQQQQQQQQEHKSATTTTSHLSHSETQQSPANRSHIDDTTQPTAETTTTMTATTTMTTIETISPETKTEATTPITTTETATSCNSNENNHDNLGDSQPDSVSSPINNTNSATITTKSPYHNHNPATQHNHYHNNSYHQPAPRYNHHHHHHNHNNMSYAARSSNQRGHNANQQHQKYHHNHNSSHHHHHHHHHQHQQQQQQQQQTYEQQLPAEALPASAAAPSSRSPPQPHQAELTGPPHYVDLHVNPGECISLKLMNGQEQVVPGPATIKMISQLQNPPVPLPIQAPYGHMIHQVADENGILKHIILSIMGANEDGSQHDSTVINFPQGPFRIDSHGQLVSINNAGGGGGGGASNEAMPLTSLPPQVYFANYDGCPPIAYDTAAAADPAAVEPPLVGAYTAADQPTVMGAPPLPAGATSGDPSYHSLQAPQTTSELGSPQYKSQMLAAGNYPSQPTAYPQPQASYEHNHHHHHHHVPVGATMASVVSSNINKQSAQQQQLLVNNQALPQSPAAYNVQTGGCYPPPEDQYHALVMPANQTTRYGRHHESQALLAKDKSGRYQGTNVKAINHNNNHHHHHHHHNQHLGINNVPSRASVSPQRLARVKNNNLAPQQQNHTNQHNLHHHHHSQWNGVGRNHYQAPDYEKPPPSPSNASSINSNSSSNRQQTTKSYAYHAHQQPVIPSAAHQIHPLGNKQQQQQQQHINNPLVFNQAQAPHYHTPNGQVVGKGPKSQQANKVAGSAKRPKSANNSNHGQDNLVMVDVSSTDTMRHSDAKYLTTLVSPSEAPCPINDTDDQLFVLTAPPEQHQAGDQGAQASRSSRGKQKKCQNQSQQGNNKAAASIDRQSVDSNRQGSHQHNNSSTKLLARAGSLVNKQHQASHADNRLDSGGVDKVVSIASDSSVGGKVTNNSSDGKQANKQQSNEKQQGKQSKKNRPLDKLQSSLVGNKQSGCGEPSKRSEHLGKIAKVDGDEELNLSPLSSSSATCGNLNGNNNNNNDKQAQQHQQEQSSSNNKTNGSNGRELTSTSSVGARAANNNEANLVCSEIANKRSSFSGRQNSIELQPLPSSLSSGDLDQNLGKTEFPAVTAIKQRRGSDGKQSIKIVDSSSPSSPARRHQPKKASLVHDATSDHAVQLLPEITINDQQVAVGDDEILLVSTSCESQPASEKDAQTKGVVRAPPVTVTMRTSLSENNIKSLHDKQLSLLSAKSTQTTPTLTAAGSSSSAKSASSLSGSHSSSSVSNQEHHAGKKKTSGDKRKNGVKSCTTSAVSSANLGKKGLVKHVRNSMDPALLDTNAISNHHNISNSPLISSSSSSSGPGYRNNNNSSSHSSNSNHSSGGSGSTKTISQPIKYSFKQCRNKFVSILGRLVQNSLSTYSDAKFAGLLLVMFTIFAMLLAIFIHIYISE